VKDVVTCFDRFGWFRGLGSGSFSDSPTYTTAAVFDNPERVQAVDLNQGSTTDLIISSFHDLSVRALYNGGTGTNWTVETIATDVLANVIETADVDGDKDLDVVILSKEGLGVSVPMQLPLPHGVLADPDLEIADLSARSMGVGDVDGNGSPDVVSAYYNRSEGDVWAGDILVPKRYVFTLSACTKVVDLPTKF